MAELTLCPDSRCWINRAVLQAIADARKFGGDVDQYAGLTAICTHRYVCQHCARVFSFRKPDPSCPTCLREGKLHSDGTVPA